MRPVIIERVGVGVSSPIVVDRMQPNFKIGFGAVISGAPTYSVQHSFDNPDDYVNITDFNNNATWFDHEYVVAATANQDGNYAFPCTAVRLNMTGGTGSVKLTLLQSCTN